MAVSAETYERLALEDPDSKWELWNGCLRKKPSMTSPHFFYSFELAYQLRLHIDPANHQIRCDQSQVKNPAGYFIPDVCVVPVSHLGEGWKTATDLEVLRDPLPFVAEVWSRTTGEFDRTEKLREYQARSDLEIWLMHPYEQWVLAYTRQADGAYRETRHEGGTVPLAFLPGVTVNLDALFGA
jgi:Uma2 family endonuclease